jgi:microcystin-dependent protein
MAADVSVPNNFTAGLPSVADDVDANFTAVVNWINTNAVHLDASKAFANVPSGPSSDPTSADQLARKAYVDAIIPVGVIQQYAGTTAPNSNYLLAQGQAISRSTYATLFSLIGTTYGAGDGSTTFNIPNLKGRIPVGLDSAQTEFDALAETGGAKTHALSATEMPSHTHTQAHTHTFSGTTTSNGAHTHEQSVNVNGLGAVSTRYDYDGDTTSGLTLPQTGVNTASGGTHDHTYSGTTSGVSAANTGSAGSGGAHNNLQPYIVINYIIKVL